MSKGFVRPSDPLHDDEMRAEFHFRLAGDLEIQPASTHVYPLQNNQLPLRPNVAGSLRSLETYESV